MWKKWIRIFAAVLTVLSLTAGAAAEGMLTKFFDAGCRLLFETDNVTLGGQAVFSLDGVRFKTAFGTKIQAGNNTSMRLGLLTPRSDGTERQTGFTVIANGTDVYVMEDYTPGIYREGERFESHALIKPSVYLSSLMALGKTLTGPVEQSLGDCVRVASAENGGTVLEIRMEKGKNIPLLDGIVTLVGEYLAESYMGIDYNFYDAQSWDSGAECTVDDWFGLLKHLYEEMYGEAFPENWDTILWGQDEDTPDPEKQNLMQGRYEAVTSRIEEMIQEARNVHESGWIVIFADGTQKVYPKQDAYLIENGLQYVLYEDFMALVHQRWEKEYGETLSEETMDAIFMGEDADRLEKYTALTNAMEEEYRRMAVEDGNAAVVWVKADGTAEMIRDIQKFLESDRIHQAGTITEGIVLNMRSLSVDEAEIRAETDPEGRLRQVQGSLKLKMTDERKTEYALGVDFRFDAEEYGTSTVEAFDPAVYGVTLQTVE